MAECLAVFAKQFHQERPTSAIDFLSAFRNSIGKPNGPDYLEDFVHNFSICSSERPLVSGTHFQTNTAASTLITP